jgi:hypothetical protein
VARSQSLRNAPTWLAFGGLATAIVGESDNAHGKTIEVVRIMITDAGRRALEG